MGVVSGSRNLWFSALIVMVCLWLLFHSSKNVVRVVPSRSSSPSSEMPEYKVGPTYEEQYKTTVDGSPLSELIEKGAKGLFSSTPSTEPPPTPADMRPLIIYAYSEADFARRNLQFFVDHALHDAADFVFMLNGETDVDKTVIYNMEHQEAHAPKRSMKNVYIKRRDNACYDLGGHAEVLQSTLGGEGWFNIDGPMPAPEGAPPQFKYPRPTGSNQFDQPRDKRKRDEVGDASPPPSDNVVPELLDVKTSSTPIVLPTNPALRALKDRYKRFIMMNASIRGPFVPTWSKECWSDSYLNKVTGKTKLIGMSYNCHFTRGHVQSMIWATDSVGLSHILSPSGIGTCYAEMLDAVDGEIRTTEILRAAGYEVNAFLSVFHSKDKDARRARVEGISKMDAKDRSGPVNEKKLKEQIEAPGHYWVDCHDEDYLWDKGAYKGTFVHPYENLFMKSHRHIEDTVLDRLTEWHDGMGYDSYSVCR